MGQVHPLDRWLLLSDSGWNGGNSIHYPTALFFKMGYVLGAGSKGSLADWVRVVFVSRLRHANWNKK